MTLGCFVKDLSVSFFIYNTIRVTDNRSQNLPILTFYGYFTTRVLAFLNFKFYLIRNTS